MPVPPLSMPTRNALPRPLVEEVVDLARGLCADPGHLGKISQRRALDRLERAEMVEQGALAGRADARDLLQSRLADVTAAPAPVPPPPQSVRLAARPFGGKERRTARAWLEPPPFRHGRRAPSGR